MEDPNTITNNTIKMDTNHCKKCSKGSNFSQHNEDQLCYSCYEEKHKEDKTKWA